MLSSLSGDKSLELVSLLSIPGTPFAIVTALTALLGCTNWQGGMGVKWFEFIFTSLPSLNESRASRPLGTREFTIPFTLAIETGLWGRLLPGRGLLWFRRELAAEPSVWLGWVSGGDLRVVSSDDDTLEADVELRSPEKLIPTCLLWLSSRPLSFASCSCCLRRRLSCCCCCHTRNCFSRSKICSWSLDGMVIPFEWRWRLFSGVYWTL